MSYIEVEQEMSPIELRTLRVDVLNVSQGQMSQFMGLPKRTYEDLEAGRAKLRPVHMWAARMAALRAFLANQDITLPPDLENLVESVGHKINGTGPYEGQGARRSKPRK